MTELLGDLCQSFGFKANILKKKKKILPALFYPFIIHNISSIPWWKRRLLT
jgi:hypothetical protein